MKASPPAKSLLRFALEVWFFAAKLFILSALSSYLVSPIDARLLVSFLDLLVFEYSMPIDSLVIFLEPPFLVPVAVPRLCWARCCSPFSFEVVP